MQVNTHENLLVTVTAEIQSAQLQSRRLSTFTNRTGCESFDSAAAYQVAHKLQTAKVAAGAQLVGRKIGFTNRSLWPVYGVHQPIWGSMYANTVHYLPAAGGVCHLGLLFEPKIEPEIVLHFQRSPQLGASLQDILACIDWVALGFEIVDSPFAGWKFQAPDCIATGALHARLLVGQPWAVQGTNVTRQLESFGVSLLCNGQVRDQGAGANVLGSPLAAIAHLLEVLATQPYATPIAAGDVVTTGTLTQALSVSAGEVWSTAVQGLEVADIAVTFID